MQKNTFSYWNISATLHHFIANVVLLTQWFQKFSECCPPIVAILETQPHQSFIVRIHHATRHPNQIVQVWESCSLYSYHSSGSSSCFSFYYFGVCNTDAIHKTTSCDVLESLVEKHPRSPKVTHCLSGCYSSKWLASFDICRRSPSIDQLILLIPSLKCSERKSKVAHQRAPSSRHFH